jgi:uncharacterized protein (DUF1330 family)
MDQRIALGLAMLAGIAIGAGGGNGLHAQGKSPGAYAILDISEVVDPNVLRQQIVPKAAPSITAGGGQYIVRTDKITPLLGTPPKRVVVIAFDSVDKAKAWYESPAQKEVNALAEKALKARWFIADSALN